MTGQHGIHQRFWDALVDFAAEHTAVVCPDVHCPTSIALKATLAELFEHRPDPDEVERGLFVWMLEQWAAQLTLTARTTIADTGRPAVFELNLDTPPKAMAGALLAATMRQHSAQRDELLAAARADSAVADEIALEILQGLTLALITRHRELGALGARP